MKKYTHLHHPLTARIASEESNKKDPEKAAKTRLHQLYGAYTQPNACKKAEALLNNRDVTSLLRLHASTRERLPHYAEFYQFILSRITPPASIMDLGCGFNPFSLPLLLQQLPAAHLKIYHAYDIDTRQAAVLNQFFTLHSLPPAAECLDLAVETPTPAADLALMLKLLPVLDAQAPAATGNGFRLARSLKAKHLVITYPLKSLGGKEKGMARHYRHTFETAYNAGELSPFLLSAEQQIGTEWLYMLTNPTFSPPFPILT
jgi:16S rRNA (guanine(1405)-N(7))-methyltransferase